MANTLESYIAEAQKSYEGSRNALQNQIDAVGGQLATSQNNINQQYAQQQDTLERNRNSAAESASMRAAGSGGSFGGAANIANKKYYEQTFVPAQAQLQTNKSTDLANAERTANSNRLSLQSQLADLAGEAQRYGQSRYDAAVEADRQTALQREANAAQNPYYQYLLDAAKTNASPTYGRGAEFGLDDAGGYYFYDANGNPIKANTYATQSGTDIKSILSKMAQGGDANAIRALAGLSNAKKQLTNEEKIAFKTLGISTAGYGSRA